MTCLLGTIPWELQCSWGFCFPPAWLLSPWCVTAWERSYHPYLGPCFVSPFRVTGLYGLMSSVWELWCQSWSLFKIYFHHFRKRRETSQYYIVASVVVTWFLTILELLEGQQLRPFSIFVAPGIISLVHWVFCAGCSEGYWQWLSQCLKHYIQGPQAFDPFVHFSVPALKTGWM